MSRVVLSQPGLSDRCEVCEGKAVVAISAPGSKSDVTYLPCLGCQWGLPVVQVPMRRDR